MRRLIFVKSINGKFAIEKGICEDADYTEQLEEDNLLGQFDEYITCEHCGERHKRGMKLDGKFYCSKCAYKLIDVCRDCGLLFIPEISNHINGQHFGSVLCDDCLNKYVRCEHCNCLVKRDTISEIELGDGTVMKVCPTCAEYNFVRCDICGKYHPENWCKHCAGVTICNECSIGYIEDYGSTEAEGFFDCGSRELDPIHIGMELEIDGRKKDGARNISYRKDDIAILAAALLKKGGLPEWAMKNDCTIQEGFEMAIKNPVGFTYFNETLSPRLKEVFDKLTEIGMLGDEARSCGLHVHLSRSELTRETIISIAVLLDRFWADWQKLSRRRGEYRWCPKPTIRYYSDYETTFCESSFGRGAINNGKDETVEIRLFRSTLNHKSFVAAIHAVMFMYMLAKEKGYVGCKDMTRDEFIEAMKNFSPELKEYAIRRLGATSVGEPEDETIVDSYGAVLPDARVEFDGQVVRIIDTYMNDSIPVLAV